MAFATQCPHCQTTFRVAHDQLKLRAGLVRCGACKEIFNGVEHLLRSDDVPAMPAAQSSDVTSHSPPREIAFPDDPPPIQASFAVSDPSPESREGTLPSVFVDSPSSPEPIFLPESASEVDTSEPIDAPAHIDSDDASDHSNAMDSAFANPAIDVEPAAEYDPENREPLDPHPLDATPVVSVEPIAGLDNVSEKLVHHSAHESADELDQAIDYLQRKPWRGTKHALSREDVEGRRVSDNESHASDSDSDLPDFVSRSRALQQRQQSLHRALIALAVLLTVGAVGQSLYIWRDQIAARLPASKPLLTSACQALGCRIELPAQIDAVSIESNELVTLAPEKNIFGLNLLLRNRSTLPQRWPAIELTLLDTTDRPVVRRVFKAGDYTPSAIDLTRGFAPNTEQSAKIIFELVGQKAANYRVTLFYP